VRADCGYEVIVAADGKGRRLRHLGRIRRPKPEDCSDPRGRRCTEQADECSVAAERRCGYPGLTWGEQTGPSLEMLLDQSTLRFCGPVLAFEGG
jgi:hypothetical protein